MEIAAEVRFKNGLLYRAVQKCGSQSKLAEFLGVKPTQIGAWLNFRECPKFRTVARRHHELYELIDAKLVSLIGYGLEEVFPIEVEVNKEALKIHRMMVHMADVPVEMLCEAGVAPKLPLSPEVSLRLLEMGDRVRDAVQMLNPRQEKVIAMRFGLPPYSKEHTLEEVACEFGVTRERIRQVEAKALRLLRHPKLSRRLKEYFEEPVR